MVREPRGPWAPGGAPGAGLRDRGGRGRAGAGSPRSLQRVARGRYGKVAVPVARYSIQTVNALKKNEVTNLLLSRKIPLPKQVSIYR